MPPFIKNTWYLVFIKYSTLCIRISRSLYFYLWVKFLYSSHKPMPTPRLGMTPLDCSHTNLPILLMYRQLYHLNLVNYLPMLLLLVIVISWSPHWVNPLSPMAAYAGATMWLSPGCDQSAPPRLLDGCVDRQLGPSCGIVTVCPSVIWNYQPLQPLRSTWAYLAQALEPNQSTGSTQSEHSTMDFASWSSFQDATLLPLPLKSHLFTSTEHHRSNSSSQHWLELK